MKPSILFIMHFPPPINGGASLMGKAIKESVVINRALEADYINLATSDSLEKIGKSGPYKLLILFKILHSMIYALKRKHYHLCYITLTAKGIGFYKDLIIVVILKLLGKRMIFHLHNKGVAAASRNKINNLLYRFAFGDAKCILLSPLLYDDIKKYVKPENVFYCPNGISNVRASVSLAEEWVKDGPGICRLLFLSNMMFEKGVLVLLEACKLLKERNLCFECHFVGAWVDISERQFMKKVELNGLFNTVFAHGPKYGDEKYHFLEMADIFVFPTYFHNETFGLVNLEAMQHALPIVSTPEGGISDVVKDGTTGFLVPQRNVQILADKLELLIRQPDLRVKMGKEGKKRFEELYTIEKFEQKLKYILITAAQCSVIVNRS